MKKLILGTISAAVLVSSAAAGVGVEVGSAVVNTKESKLLKIQPLTELTGSDEREVYLGLYKQFDNIKIGGRYTKVGSDEHKIELRTKINGTTPVSNLSWFLGFGAGGGAKKTGTQTISTNITKIAYITQTDLSVFEAQTDIKTNKLSYFTVSFGAGLDYNITTNLALSAGVESEVKYWDISYRHINTDDVIDISGQRQSNIKALVVLNYRF